MSYSWSIGNGTITSGGAGSSITFTAAGGSGTVTLTCTVTNAAGTHASASNSSVIAAVPNSPSFSLPTYLTSGIGYAASIAAQPGMSYSWTINNGSFTSGVGGTSVTFIAGGSGALSLTCVVTNAAGTTAVGTGSATISTAPTSPTVSLPANVTAGMGYTASISGQSGMNYAWTISNGTLSGSASGTSVAFTAGSSGAVTLSCSVTNAAGTVATGSATATVVVAPSAPTVSLPGNVTAGQGGITASIQAQSGMAYAWTISNGTITSTVNGTSVTFTAAGSGSTTLTCQVSNAAGTSVNGSGSASICAAPVATVTVPSQVTANLGGYLASVVNQAGYTYSWTITNGSLTAGQGTPQVTFTAGGGGATSLTCTVTNLAQATATGTSSSLIVAGPTRPELTAPAKATSNQSGYQVTTPTQSGCTFTWTIGNGTLTSGQGTSTATFSVGASGTTTISCTAANSVGTLSTPGTASCLIVDPPTTPTINLPGTVTAGVPGYTASVPPQTSSTYSWGITGGTLTSSNTSTSVVFTPGGGTSVTLTCRVTNGAGTVSALGSQTASIVSMPSILGLVPDRLIVTSGNPTVLVASFQGGTATVDGVPGSWTTSPASISVTPGAPSTTYTLRVVNFAGTSCTPVTVSVQVVAAPSIASFASSEARISTGETVSLTGIFSNGTGSISNGIGAVSSNEAKVISPTQTTTYRLTVTNAAGSQAVQDRQVEVFGPGVINSFTGNGSSTPKIHPGETIQLSPTFSGGTGVITDNQGSNPIQVTSGTNYSRTPSSNTTYTLTVTNPAGDTTEMPLSVIVGFTLRRVKDIAYLNGVVVAEIENGVAKAMLTDRLGTPRVVVDGGGTIILEQKFTPFGESLTTPSESLRPGKGFTNHEQTDPSGLIYMQARYCLPMYGRFEAPDPEMDQNLEDIQSWNLYSYVRNNPINSIDPTGTWEQKPKIDKNKQEEVAQAAQGAEASAAPANPGPSVTAGPAPSTGVRTPDIFTLTFGVGEGVFGVAGISIDRNLNVYGFLGGGVGVAGPAPVSGSLTGGWLTQSDKPSEQKIISTVKGRATEISGGFVVGGGSVMAPSKPRIVNGGAYSPQVSATITGTKPLFNLGSAVKAVGSATVNYLNSATYQHDPEKFVRIAGNM